MAHVETTGKIQRPSTCTICYNLLLMYDRDTEDDELSTDTPADDIRPFVALKCGHLFHTKCAIGWFKSHDGDNPDLKPCPYCRRETRWSEPKRLLPVSSCADMCDVRYTGNKNEIPRIRHRPGPATCIICLDFILVFATVEDNESISSESSKMLRPIVVLKCGHYYHTPCIKGWFKKSAEGSTLIKCPICRREASSCDTRRIFPVTSGAEE